MRFLRFISILALILNLIPQISVAQRKLVLGNKEGQLKKGPTIYPQLKLLSYLQKSKDFLVLPVMIHLKKDCDVKNVFLGTHQKKKNLKLNIQDVSSSGYFSSFRYPCKKAPLMYKATIGGYWGADGFLIEKPPKYPNKTPFKVNWPFQLLEMKKASQAKTSVNPRVRYCRDSC